MVKAHKKPEFEYRLTIGPHFNERRQIRTILLSLETTKAFANFRYELSVDEQVTDRELRFTIAGLKAPKLSLPDSGSARFIREYDHLKGKWTITIVSLDGTENSFLVQFTAKTITLLKSPRQPFTEVHIA